MEMKKILSLLLALVMLAGMLPVGAFAEADGGEKNIECAVPEAVSASVAVPDEGDPEKKVSEEAVTEEAPAEEAQEESPEEKLPVPAVTEDLPTADAAKEETPMPAVTENQPTADVTKEETSAKTEDKPTVAVTEDQPTETAEKPSAPEKAAEEYWIVRFRTVGEGMIYADQKVAVKGLSAVIILRNPPARVDENFVGWYTGHDEMGFHENERVFPNADGEVTVTGDTTFYARFEEARVLEVNVGAEEAGNLVNFVITNVPEDFSQENEIVSVDGEGNPLETEVSVMAVPKEEPAAEITEEGPTVEVPGEAAAEVIAEEPAIETTGESRTVEETEEELTVEVTGEELTVEVTEEELTVEVTEAEPTMEEGEELSVLMTEDAPIGSGPYTVTLIDSVDGSEIGTVTTDKDGYFTKPKNPTHKGRTFYSWFTDQEKTKPVEWGENNKFRVTEDTKIYAGFIVNLTVSYGKMAEKTDKTGKTYPKTIKTKPGWNEARIHEDEGGILPVSPMIGDVVSYSELGVDPQTGQPKITEYIYKFAGWKEISGANPGILFSSGAEVVVEETTVIQAQWHRLRKVTVKFTPAKYRAAGTVGLLSGTYDENGNPWVNVILTHNDEFWVWEDEPYTVCVGAGGLAYLQSASYDGDTEPVVGQNYEISFVGANGNKSLTVKLGAMGAAKTGDDFNPGMWTILAAVSLAGLGCTLGTKKRFRKKESSAE